MPQGLHSPQQAVGAGGAQQDAVGGDGEPVALVTVVGARVEAQGEAPVGARGERESGGGGEQRAQQVGGSLGARVGAQAGVPVEDEAAGQRDDGVGAGDERESGVVVGHGAESSPDRRRNSP